MGFLGAMYFLPFFMFAAAFAEWRADEALFVNPLVLPCTMVALFEEGAWRDSLSDGGRFEGGKQHDGNASLLTKLFFARELVGVSFRHPPNHIIIILAGHWKADACLFTQPSTLTACRTKIWTGECSLFST